MLTRTRTLTPMLTPMPLANLRVACPARLAVRACICA